MLYLFSSFSHLSLVLFRFVSEVVRLSPCNDTFLTGSMFEVWRLLELWSVLSFIVETKDLELLLHIIIDLTVIHACSAGHFKFLSRWFIRSQAIRQVFFLRIQLPAYLLLLKEILCETGLLTIKRRFINLLIEQICCKISSTFLKLGWAEIFFLRFEFLLWRWRFVLQQWHGAV